MPLGQTTPELTQRVLGLFEKYLLNARIGESIKMDDSVNELHHPLFLNEIWKDWGAGWWPSAGSCQLCCLWGDGELP